MNELKALKRCGFCKKTFEYNSKERKNPKFCNAICYQGFLKMKRIEPEITSIGIIKFVLKTLINTVVIMGLVVLLIIICAKAL